jgi:uridine kinase
MKLIFISGPSGSGKTTLSNKILLKIKNGYILSTDNYYRTGLISKVLSKFVRGYFDRNISFNYKLFKKDLNFIIKNKISILERSYDFKKKKIKNYQKNTNNIEFLIIEGIFAKELSNTIFNHMIFSLELKKDRNVCMNRVIKRDSTERGKKKEQAQYDFSKSWDIYYEKSQNKHIKRNTNEIIITDNTNIDEILKKIFKL